MFPWQYAEFCLKISMERQKIITCKKKFIKKDLFVEEISYFQEQKIGHFPQNLQTYQWKTNENRSSRFPIFIDFPLKVSRILREISDFFALENNISPR